MVDIFLQFVSSYPILFFGLIVSEIILILVAIRFMADYSIKSYDNVQKIHSGHTSRLGGLCILITLFIAFISRPFMIERQFIYGLFFCFTPVLFITIFEDFHIQLRPLYRMLAMLLASFLLCFITIHSLPELTMPYIGPVINLPYVLPIFYSIALIALMNGMNFVDGANGLLSVTVLSVFLGLGLITFFIKDFDFLMIILLFSIPLLVFLIFNYPWGIIFMGDVGAYWYGWVSGGCVIYLFSKHDELLTWSAPVLLFYPTMEVIFSFVRKVIQKKSPFEPDGDHLHLRIYYMFSRAFKDQPRRANNLVMPLLTFFWLTPPILAALFYHNLFLTLLSLVMLMIIYIWLYLRIPSKISG